MQSAEFLCWNIKPLRPAHMEGLKWRSLRRHFVRQTHRVYAVDSEFEPCLIQHIEGNERPKNCGDVILWNITSSNLRGGHSVMGWKEACFSCVIWAEVCSELVCVHTCCNACKGVRRILWVTRADALRIVLVLWREQMCTANCALQGEITMTFFLFFIASVQETNTAVFGVVGLSYLCCRSCIRPWPER